MSTGFVHDNELANEPLGCRDEVVCRWTPGRVRASLDAFVGNGPIVVLANREPIRHDRAADGSIVDRRRNVVTCGDRRTAVRAYPVSVEWPNRWACQASSVEACRVAVRRRLRLPPDLRLVVGVDRLDYTKGIEEKFQVFERLLEMRPAFRERLVLVQIAEPSRTHVPAYPDAVIVNPYAIDDSAHALARALSMSQPEQATRMRAMRAVVAEFNAYRWVGEMLTDAALLGADRAHDGHKRDWPANALQVS